MLRTLVSATALMAAPLTAHALVLDDFQDTSTVMLSEAFAPLSPNGDGVFEQNDPTALDVMTRRGVSDFDTRDIDVALRPGEMTNGQGSAMADAGGGQFTITNSPRNGSITTLGYDFTGGGSLDLAPNGEQFIGFSDASLDFGDREGGLEEGSLTLSLEVMTTSGNQTLTQTFSDTDEPSFLGFQFGDFDTSMVDFSSVTGLTFTFNADREFDFSATRLATNVPVPAALPLLVLGLGGLAWAARRRQADEA
ncbi:MAG: VPLPA-CTERM sorting domain-containing protein [Paracoccaceae bacterium]